MITRPYLLLCLVVLFLPDSSYAAEIPKYVGRKACLRCHTPENRMVQETSHDSEKSCEQCHGSGEMHLKSSGDRNSMFSFIRATAAEVRARCVQCHRNAIMDRHSVGDVSCISCHSIHHYVHKKGLLKADDYLLNSARLHKRR